MGSKQVAAGRRPVTKASPTGKRTGLGSGPGTGVAGRVTKPARPITPDDRYRMIAEAAYFRAMRRGFASGGEVQDWLEAEADVDARLQSG